VVRRPVWARDASPSLPAALGQADADEQQGDGELVGDVLEVVADLGRAAVPRAQEVQVVNYQDAHFA
jgi:hypothetical protein